MLSLRELKEDLNFNIELGDLLKVMQTVAVFKFRSFQQKRQRFELFVRILSEFLGTVDLNKTPVCFVSPKSKKAAVIVITSDEGFTGGLNMEVVEKALSYEQRKDTCFLVVGSRGLSHFREIGKECVYFKRVNKDDNYRLGVELRDFVINGVRSVKFGRVVVVYPRLVSFVIQRPEVVDLLPLSDMSSFYFAGKDISDNGADDVIVESPLEGIVGYLVETFVLEKLVDILDESRLSECAARAIHLEKSGQDLEELRAQIRFRYFRAYHERIDRSIRELFSSQIILRK